MSWLDVAKQYPECRSLIVEHIKGNISYSQDMLRFKHEEIGLMARVRNNSPPDSELKQWTQFFITLFTAETEELTSGIEDDRRTITEITGL